MSQWLEGHVSVGRALGVWLSLCGVVGRTLSLVALGEAMRTLGGVHSTAGDAEARESRGRAP